MQPQSKMDNMIGRIETDAEAEQTSSPAGEYRPLAALPAPETSSAPGKRGKSGNPGKPAKHEKSLSRRDADSIRMVREQCEKLATSIFYNEQAPLRSLGFTSVVSGEGKSFLATTTAALLGTNTDDPVTIVECNWEHPSLAELFDVPSGPGLAEWARGECPKTAIRYAVNDNLTVIPAGDGQVNVLSTLQRIRDRGLLDVRLAPNEMLVVDLPPVLTSTYGTFAASLVEALVIVVRAGVTPSPMIAETCDQLRELPVHGILLNHITSKIPHWLSKVL